MASTEVPAEVFDLYKRLSDRAQPDGSWSEEMLISVLCRWFVDNGVRDLYAPLSTYHPAPASNPTTHQEGQS